MPMKRRGTGAEAARKRHEAVLALEMGVTLAEADRREIFRRETLAGEHRFHCSHRATVSGIDGWRRLLVIAEQMLEARGRRIPWELPFVTRDGTPML